MQNLFTTCVCKMEVVVVSAINFFLVDSDDTANEVCLRGKHYVKCEAQPNFLFILQPLKGLPTSVAAHPFYSVSRSPTIVILRLRVMEALRTCGFVCTFYTKLLWLFYSFLKFLCGWLCASYTVPIQILNATRTVVNNFIIIFPRNLLFSTAFS